MYMRTYGQGSKRVIRTTNPSMRCSVWDDNGDDV